MSVPVSEASIALQKKPSCSNDEARMKLDTGEWVLCKNEAGRSAAWSKFGQVLESSSRTYMNFVQCFDCKLLKLFRMGTGTGALVSHQCTFRSRPSTSAVVTAEMKQSFSNACIDLCAGDVRPFDVVTGPHFRQLVQSAIDIGAAVGGSVNADDVIPHRTQLSRKLSARADTARAEILPGIVNAIREGRCACTTDMWTENFHHTHYLTVTAHVISSEWKLKNYVLFTAKFPHGPATAENMLDELLTLFATYDITREELQKVVFVTDGGSNIKKALTNFTRLYCTTHLNIILKSAMRVKLSEIDLYGDAGGFICSTVQSTIEYLKSCKDVPRSLLRKLQTVPVCRRYKSRVPMLKSLQTNWNQVIKILQKKDQFHRVASVTLQEIHDLILFISAVEKRAVKPSMTLQSSSFPALRDLCDDREDDSPLEQALRENARSELAILEALFQIDQCKCLVAYLKRSGLVTRLDNTLKQEVETRWNSTVTMLRSVIRGFEQAYAILAEVNEDHRMTGISKPVIESLVEFLEVFERETDRLQAENVPTLHFVLLSIRKLQRHCSPRISDGFMRSQLLATAMAKLRLKFLPHALHKIAVFLHPEFRGLLMLSPQERTQVHAAVRKMCEDLSAVTQYDASLPIPQAQPPHRIPDVDDDGFNEWRENIIEDGTDVDLYLTNAVIRRGENILEWWKDMESRYPKLSKVAQAVLCIPASSAPSERVFSTAGNIITSRRTPLKPENVDHILFLHNVLKNNAVNA